MEKNNLRKEIRNRKRQFTQQQLSELSLSVISRLKEHPRMQDANVVLLYYSLPDEVNTHQLVDDLVAQGKEVLLPVVIDGENMEIREYHGIKDMRESSYHILEPVGKTFTEFSRIQLAVIPGMSFDDDGNRLGRGKGYYDRFLAHIPEAYKIGICFDFQRVANVPTEKTDQKVNEVIS